MLDSVIEALGDASVVAPLVTAAQLHNRPVTMVTSGGTKYKVPTSTSTSSRMSRKHKTYMYVFGHQTRQGDYVDRLGCISGEELAYVFGAPLTAEGQLSHFIANYTSVERELAEAVITMWTNFAKTGYVLYVYQIRVY